VASGCFVLKDGEKSAEETEQDACSVKETEDHEVFLPAAVCAEEHEHTNTCAYQKTGEHGTGGHSALQIKLGDDHGGCAVGDETDDAGKKLADEGLVEDKQGKPFFPERMDDKVNDEGDSEQEKEDLVYYLIQDEGLWPDGCSFPRYTVLYVDKYKDEYEHIKKYIQMCEIVPAYVINQEATECSEITEIGFRNVSGLIINAT